MFNQFVSHEAKTLNSVTVMKIAIFTENWLVAAAFKFDTFGCGLNEEVSHQFYLRVTYNVYIYVIQTETLERHSQEIKLDLRIGEPMQNCIHRKDNSPKSVNHCLTLKERPKVKSDHTEDLKPMISCKLVSHCKPLGSIIS